jgi:predicted RNA binding protein YcfA (HicA-like mRNA interferase family)
MKLPILKSREIIAILKRIGFIEIRKTGSHLILVNKESKKIISVPVHNKDIKRGLLVGIVKQTGLTPQEFIKLK